MRAVGVGTNPVEWCQAEVRPGVRPGFLLAHLQLPVRRQARHLPQQNFPKSSRLEPLNRQRQDSPRRWGLLSRSRGGRAGERAGFLLAPVQFPIHRETSWPPRQAVGLPQPTMCSPRQTRRLPRQNLPKNSRVELVKRDRPIPTRPRDCFPRSPVFLRLREWKKVPEGRMKVVGIKTNPVEWYQAEVRPGVRAGFLLAHLRLPVRRQARHLPQPNFPKSSRLEPLNRQRQDSPKRWERFPLSLGERAGEREGFLLAHLHLPVRRQARHLPQPNFPKSSRLEPLNRQRQDSPRRWARFPLSPGERAGVRAGFLLAHLHLPVRRQTRHLPRQNFPKSSRLEPLNRQRQDSPKRWARFPLSPGERAGVRASSLLAQFLLSVHWEVRWPP